MRIEKKVIGKLEKCYALAPFFYKGKECFLAASEKEAECRIYDMEGNMLEVVWDSPGGVMTMVQNPDSGALTSRSAVGGDVHSPVKQTAEHADCRHRQSDDAADDFDEHPARYLA